MDYSASNGLVANKSKTVFLVLNDKNKDSNVLDQVRVGDALIERSSSAKLLGMVIEESQEWNEHFRTLQTALNQRLYIIRRLLNQIPKQKIMGIVHSLWMSKLRYGLQLCTRVTTKNEDRKTASMKALQLTQNRMLRVINGSRIKDMISIESMLSKFNLLSVNQLAAQIKITEVWKSINIDNYPVKLDGYNKHEKTTDIELRAQPNRVFDDTFRLQISQQSFNADAAKLWNQVPDSIKSAKTLTAAKTATLKHVKSFPI